MESGIIAVNKPEGISSAAVVARVKKAFKVKKVGHTGTLDPFATGLLLCAVNQGTRISQYFLDGHKCYRAKICLGVETDTYDLTGKQEFCASKEIMADLDEKKIKTVVESFLGLQDQVPPSFSALKHKGQPLYKLARQGKKIQKPPRKIEIFSMDILSIEMPHVDVDIHCSAGTYIRSLAFDIGRKLGCGAHLAALCRTGSSQFKLEDAIDLERLETMEPDNAIQRMIRLSDCLEFMPGVKVDKLVSKKIQFGQKLSIADIKSPGLEPGHPFKLEDDQGNLLAIIQLSENGQVYNYSCVFSN